MTTTRLDPNKTVNQQKRLQPRADDYRPDTSLAEFSAEVDAHMGARVGFGEHVVELYRVRTLISAIEAHRKRLREAVTLRYEGGATRAALQDGTVVEVRRSKPTPIVTSRAAPSAAVKKASVKLWEAGKTIKPFTQVKDHPLDSRKLSIVAPLGIDPLAAVPRELADVVAALKDAPTVGALRDEEAEHVEMLDKIAANCGWDGLPIEFGDRWLVGLKRLQFDSEHLRAVDPEAWERLAVPRTSGGTSRLYLATLGVTEAAEAGLIDLDGE